MFLQDLFKVCSKLLYVKYKFVDCTFQSISPGRVETEMTAKLFEGRDINILKATDVADTILYALAVPQRVNVSKIHFFKTQLKHGVFLKRRVNKFFFLIKV